MWIIGQISLVTDMVQLRYANYLKDYFMGILPSSQYGSVAVMSSSYDLGGASSNRIITDPLSSPLRVTEGSYRDWETRKGKALTA